MTRSQFALLLRGASDAAYRIANQMVEQPLPRHFTYNVLLNQSADHNATPDERLYPQDEGRELLCIDEEQVLGTLCRDGRCPEWVDINAAAVGDKFTVLQLRCCGRFTDDLKKLYYQESGMGPFGVKSPPLPVDWHEGQRFPLKRFSPL